MWEMGMRGGCGAALVLAVWTTICECTHQHENEAGKSSRERCGEWARVMAMRKYEWQEAKVASVEWQSGERRDKGRCQREEMGETGKEGRAGRAGGGGGGGGGEVRGRRKGG